MFQWIKKKLAQRKNKLESKLKQEILDLNETLEKQLLLYDIKTKQYNDFMVESELRVKRVRDLLEKEKTTNGKLLAARVKQIAELKKQNEDLQKEVINLKDNNSVLRGTLGHF